jgi:hypothetical protein
MTSDATLAAKSSSGRQLREFAVGVAAQKQVFVLNACQFGGAVETFARRGQRQGRIFKTISRCFVWLAGSFIFF